MDPAAYLLVNFGGPRSLEEVFPFLRTLLCDQEVIRSGLPGWMHRWLFSRIAKKRSLKVTKDYASIGGKSPLYEDTEWLCTQLSERWRCPVWAFHRYLPSTHAALFARLESIRCGEIRLLPMFPQFSYATTGSAATYFSSKLPSTTLRRFRWVKSYPTYPNYIDVWERSIRDLLATHHIQEEELFLLCSAHGLPLEFIQSGDPYHLECSATYRALLSKFPKAQGVLSFQSQFGPAEWTRPYTRDLASSLGHQLPQHMKVIVVPISFTSDHLETLFEIEEEYLPPLRAHNIQAYRLPAFNRHPDWVTVLHELGKQEDLCVPHAMLVRHKGAYRDGRIKK